MILSSLHLDAAVAVREAQHIDEMVELAAGVMNLGQWRGEIPEDRDSRLIGAMIIGGMRRVLAIALASNPPLHQEDAVRKLWVMNAGIMGIDPGVDAVPAPDPVPKSAAAAGGCVASTQ